MLSLTEPEATALLDRDTVAAELGISGAANLARLERLIAAVSARVAGACGRRHFGACTATQTEHVPSRLGRNMHSREAKPQWLLHWPVTAISSVTLDGAALEAGDYEISDERALWRMDGNGYRCGWTGAKLVVVYTGGYDLPSEAPKDLADVAQQLVHAGWSAGNRDPMARRINVPDVMEQEFWIGDPASLEGGFTEAHESVLANYRNFSFG